MSSDPPPWTFGCQHPNELSLTQYSSHKIYVIPWGRFRLKRKLWPSRQLRIEARKDEGRFITVFQEQEDGSRECLDPRSHYVRSRYSVESDNENAAISWGMLVAFLITPMIASSNILLAVVFLIILFISVCAIKHYLL